MIRVKSCLLAESIEADPTTGQSSVLGVIEVIRASSFPLTIPKLAFFMMLEREASDAARCRAKFSIRQGNRGLALQSMDIDFGEELIVRVELRLSQFTIPSPGPVAFRLAPEGAGAIDYVVQASPGVRGSTI